MRKISIGTRVVNRAWKSIYWPICRAYAHIVLDDKPADSFFRFLCSFQFLHVHRFWPNFINPKRFTEKLWSRMLHDRNPQLTLMNDKLRVRSFVKERAGADFLIDLIWTGSNADDIPFDRMPAKYVIKTNHGCAHNIFIKDGSKLDRVEILRRIKKWLEENYCTDTGLGIEWGYKNIIPAIIIEPFLEENGTVPIDYKFYCFSGRVEFLTVHFDRFIEHKTRSFSRYFEPYDFRYDFEQWRGNVKRPMNFEIMIKLAESLSKGIDFVRVDLYSTDNHIYFSELTPYPGGISTKFLPPSRDYILGDKWNKSIFFQ